MSFEKFKQHVALVEEHASQAVDAAANEPLQGFAALGLHAQLLRTLQAQQYNEPTPVQAAAIPVALQGQDMMVSAATGSGKTAAFMLPALHRLAVFFDEALAQQAATPPAAAPQAPAGKQGRDGWAKPQHQRDRRPARGGFARIARPGGTGAPRVLVLAPTRELAQQVARAGQTYGAGLPELRLATVTGGASYELQLRQLWGPVDILVATPGRLMDHLRSGKVKLDHVDLLVLDEADRMLDLGFIDDIEHIVAHTPDTRQTVMFSATFAGQAGTLAQRLLKAPRRIELSTHRSSHADIEQRLHWADNAHHKNELLRAVLGDVSVKQAVVFTSTQQDADVLARDLADMGHSAAPLHGGMPQGARNRTLRALRDGHLRILVATDVAARGIDVPTISHVVNYGLPMNAEDYVHRIGRTGRAGRSGLAVTLAHVNDGRDIQRIERFIQQRIPVATVPGLEPALQPRMMADRPRRFGGKPGGKPWQPRGDARGAGGPHKPSGYARKPR
ncbi:MAG: DEAD/DEAH box helicase [Betaproteobacteria bacterium]|nr:DEAD/DEAH box helicase [Betaproteobacteria bacterium]MDE2047263.1 DEAD/DEAH box helicase [Betaproteobacteria bacterium]